MGVFFSILMFFSVVIAGGVLSNINLSNKIRGAIAIAATNHGIPESNNVKWEDMLKVLSAESFSQIIIQLGCKSFKELPEGTQISLLDIYSSMLIATYSQGQSLKVRQDVISSLGYFLHYQGSRKVIEGEEDGLPEGVIFLVDKNLKLNLKLKNAQRSIATKLMLGLVSEPIAESGAGGLSTLAAQQVLDLVRIHESGLNQYGAELNKG